MLAEQILTAAGVPRDLQLYGPSEAQRIQHWLDNQMGVGEVRLVIFHREQAFRVLWKGDRPARFTISLVLQDGHYAFIQRPEQLFRVC